MAEILSVDEIEFDYLIPNSKKELFLSTNQQKKVKEILNEISTSLNHNITTIKKLFSNGTWSINQKKNYFKNKSCYLSSLEISHGGDTSPCCLLWNSKINKKFNIKMMKIKDIWKYYQSFRLNLRRGNFPPDCIKNCYYALKS